MHTYFRSDRTRGLSGPTIICICAYTQCERILIPTAKFFPLFVSHPRLALSFLPFFHSLLLFLLVLFLSFSFLFSSLPSFFLLYCSFGRAVLSSLPGPLPTGIVPLFVQVRLFSFLHTRFFPFSSGAKMRSDIG